MLIAGEITIVDRFTTTQGTALVLAAVEERSPFSRVAWDVVATGNRLVQGVATRGAAEIIADGWARQRSLMRGAA